MLPVSNRNSSSDGFYVTGEYTLAIAAIRDGTIDANNLLLEYTFSPNPTDIDTGLMFPNDVMPDQADGVYVEMNEVGTGQISIRGHTGQFPERSALSRFGAGSAAGSVSSTLRAIPNSNFQRTIGNRNGYELWMALYNFFSRWNDEVRQHRYERAMLFINHKDVEFLHVVPNQFRKVRTAAKPLKYAYDISLTILGEVDYTQRTDWSEEMQSVRSQINRWRNLVSRSMLLLSSLATDIALGSIGYVTNPIQENVIAMSAGVQGLQAAGSVISQSADLSAESLRDPTTMAYLSEMEAAYENRPRTLQDLTIPGGLVPYIVSPTPEVVASVYGPNDTLMALTSDALTGLGSVSSEKTDLSLDDGIIGTYEHIMDLYFTGLMSADMAPADDFTPSQDSSMEIRDMHRMARFNASSMLDGRAEEFASSVLAQDTDVVDGVRHPTAKTGRSVEEYSLSYVAAKVLPSWIQSDGSGVPASLEAFRREFLGMRDPSTQQPLYRIIKVSAGDTIYSLAAKHLGSWLRWTEIAFLNNLSYPYISAQAGNFTVGPGDTLYVPLKDAKVSSELVANLLNIQSVHDKVSLQDLFLGFDWEVSAITGDFVWSEFDFAFVSGVAAFQQEMAIVLEGSGGVTPDQIAQIPIKIGTKSRGNATLNLWKTVISNWLDHDPRVAFVEWVSIKQDGDRIAYSVKLQFEHYDESVTIAGALRN